MAKNGASLSILIGQHGVQFVAASTLVEVVFFWEGS